MHFYGYYGVKPCSKGGKML